MTSSFFIEITVDSLRVIRNDTERFFKHFRQFSPMIMFYKTIIKYNKL